MGEKEAAQNRQQKKKKTKQKTRVSTTTTPHIRMSVPSRCAIHIIQKHKTQTHTNHNFVSAKIAKTGKNTQSKSQNKNTTREKKHEKPQKKTLRIPPPLQHEKNASLHENPTPSLPPPRPPLCPHVYHTWKYAPVSCSRVWATE